MLLDVARRHCEFIEVGEQAGQTPPRIATHRKSPLEFQTHDESGRRFADCSGGKLDYLRFDQLFELLPGQSNQFSMRACVKCNLLILRQAFIRKNLDSVQISEGWHGACFGNILSRPNPYCYDSNHMFGVSNYCALRRSIWLFSRLAALTHARRHRWGYTM